MDRDIWESISGFVESGSIPPLPCPYCSEYKLAIESETFSIAMGSAPLAEIELKRQKEKSDAITNSLFPEKPLGKSSDGITIFGVLLVMALAAENAGKSSREPAKFVSFLRCSACNGCVSSTGTAIIKRTIAQKAADAQGEIDIKNSKALKDASIKFEYFSPPLPVFQLSSHVPEEVQGEMLQAFNHIHADPSSSGAKLRRALEKMCASLGVKARNLHSAIEKLKESYPREAELLLAIKLLGNEATHADSVEYSDLLDAFEVQEFVLKVYDRIHEQNQLDDKQSRLLDKFGKRT